MLLHLLRHLLRRHLLRSLRLPLLSRALPVALCMLLLLLRRRQRRRNLLRLVLMMLLLLVVLLLLRLRRIPVLLMLLPRHIRLTGRQWQRPPLLHVACGRLLREPYATCLCS